MGCNPLLSSPGSRKHAFASPGRQPPQLRDAVRQGLPFSALEALNQHLQLTQQQVTAVLGIPPRTLARRKASRHLTPQESDRVYRVARAIDQAVDCRDRHTAG
ncbi:MAG: antitoxin Xre-like helix-turn-helix domain-containing protein [Cyanobacteriota bacterium]